MLENSVRNCEMMEGSEKYLRMMVYSFQDPIEVWAEISSWKVVRATYEVTKLTGSFFTSFGISSSILRFLL